MAAQPLPPFRAGFSLWAGRCSDADPGASVRTRLASEPDVTTTGTVTMGTARITVTRRQSGSNVPLSGANIAATDNCGNTYTTTTTTNSAGRTGATPISTTTRPSSCSVAGLFDLSTVT